MVKAQAVTSLFFLFFLFFSSLNVTFVAAGDLKTKKNPLAPKAYVTRYWNRKINNKLPKSQFLLSKASPLVPVDVASFSKLATAQNPSPPSFPWFGEFFGNYGPYEDYLKNDINFINYSSHSSERKSQEVEARQPGEVSYSLVNKKKMSNKGEEPSQREEPIRFFRESNLKEGNIMAMPDIEDKMPERKFLPRTTVSKIPFSSSKWSAMEKIFNVSNSPAKERVIQTALKDCERKPNKGEIKQCVASAEDMIDFATSVLGRNVTLRKTKNNKGSRRNILMGRVKGVNGGKVTETVSCHQKLYPYLLYYCHSVPNVRAYEVDILDPKTEEKINHGVAICHLDTFTWSADHEAFHTLGSGPGQIEVCHWIFEGDLIWTKADHY